jgi:hypothetical protein
MEPSPAPYIPVAAPLEHSHFAHRVWVRHQAGDAAASLVILLRQLRARALYAALYARLAQDVFDMFARQLARGLGAATVGGAVFGGWPSTHGKRATRLINRRKHVPI